MQMTCLKIITKEIHNEEETESSNAMYRIETNDVLIGCCCCCCIVILVVDVVLDCLIKEGILQSTTFLLLLQIVLLIMSRNLCSIPVLLLAMMTSLH